MNAMTDAYRTDDTAEERERTRRVREAETQKEVQRIERQRKADARRSARIAIMKKLTVPLVIFICALVPAVFTLLLGYYWNNISGSFQYACCIAGVLVTLGLWVAVGIGLDKNGR